MHADDRHHCEHQTEDGASLSEQAAHWWVALDSENASDADRREFSGWVARSPERIAAFLRMERLLRALRKNDIRWPQTSPEVLVREALAAAEAVPLAAREAGRRLLSQSIGRKFVGKWALSGAAAALLAIVVAGLFVRVPASYTTEIGEQSSVVLEDGSTVTLNTASEIGVELRKDRRVVRLVEGEVLFQVAQDNRRPFEVIAGQTTVRALGTRFNVDRRAVSTTVTVIEGKVAVSSETAGSSHDLQALEAASPAGTVLSVAQRLVIKGAQSGIPERVDNLTAATAWTQRQLMFERRPLSEVAEEFNRYNRRLIDIDSAELRRQEVTGVFQANDPDSFVVFLSQIPGVTVRRVDDGGRIVVALAPTTADDGRRLPQN